MAGTYFMGARSFTSKKGKTLATADFLTKGNFGWQIIQKWITPEQAEGFHSDIPIGTPVIAQLDMSGNLLSLLPNDKIPELMIDDSDLL